MRAFLSHASSDKLIVEAVYDGLQASAAWLDRAEIELGDVFLDKLEQGIENSTDFILFWSNASSKSEWVRLELNMAFIRSLTSRAIRLKVILLDKTPLRLALRPYQYLDVSEEADKSRAILVALNVALKLPVEAYRHRFLNRGDELDRIEASIDDPNISIVILGGFQGIGKRSLALEAFRRFYAGVEPITTEVNPGTDLAEFALRLNAASRGVDLLQTLSDQERKREVERSLTAIAQARRPLCLVNVQHWLDDAAEPNEILSYVLEVCARVPYFAEVPLILTSTRRVTVPVRIIQNTNSVHVRDLEDKHMSTLVRIWYRASEGKELSVADADTVASHLHGYPLAAKLAAGVAAQYGADYLGSSPYPLVKIRHDIARSLLKDVRLSSDAEQILECLALIRAPVPAGVVYAAIELDEERFHSAVDQISRLDFVEMELFMSIHPILADYFWYIHWRRENYKPVALRVANAIWKHLEGLKVGTVAFSDLLPVAVRLFALAGNVEMARSIRSDLSGELLEAAIQLYNRKDYDLADKYLLHILDGDRQHWRARLYRARIMIRKDDDKGAHALLAELIGERPSDKAARHALAWMHMRNDRLEKALTGFVDIVKDGDYVRALRDGAECLHRLGRSEEALQFLARAKRTESENPYVLDLEARILEEQGKFDLALEAARLAVVRNPREWGFHHRVGSILHKMGNNADAITEFREAVALEPARFTPLSSLASAMFDDGYSVRDITPLLQKLRALARGARELNVVNNIDARLMWLDGKVTEAQALLDGEIAKGQNLIPNLGLLAKIALAEYETSRVQFPATAELALSKASRCVARGLQLEPGNEIFLLLRERLPPASK